MRIPRKLKKDLKKRYLHRYGISWLKSCNFEVEYKWFYKNTLYDDMDKSLKTGKLYGKSF